MVERVLEEIKTHKNFYRNGFYKLTRVLFYSMFVMLALLFFVLYIFFTEPTPSYYATSSNGTLVKLNSVPRGTGLIDPEDQRDLLT